MALPISPGGIACPPTPDWYFTNAAAFRSRTFAIDMEAVRRRFLRDVSM